MVPSGNNGKTFVSKSSYESFAIKAAMTMPALSLHYRSKVRVHIASLNRRDCRRKEYLGVPEGKVIYSSSFGKVEVDDTGKSKSCFTPFSWAPNEVIESDSGKTVRRFWKKNSLTQSRFMPEPWWLNQKKCYSKSYKKMPSSNWRSSWSISSRCYELEYRNPKIEPTKFNEDSQTNLPSNPVQLTCPCYTKLSWITDIILMQSPYQTKPYHHFLLRCHRCHLWWKDLLQKKKNPERMSTNLFWMMKVDQTQ